MTELKYGSKKATSLVDNYMNSRNRTLANCYVRPSSAKEKADFWCRYYMISNGGYDYRICTYNAQIFTAAFRFKEKGIEYLCYMTPTYNYKIRLY